MRLRAVRSGRWRPAAGSRAQEQEAWTWEHLAFRAHRFGVIANSRSAWLTSSAPRQPQARHDAIAGDVVEMRRAIASEKATATAGTQIAAGGLVDIEFIAQDRSRAAEHPILTLTARVG